MLLPVSAPFHCAMMKPAAERLATVLASLTINPLNVPVVTNVEAVPNHDAARVTELLVQQVCAPVRWDASVQEMINKGIIRFIEIGPGKVLSGLVKRISKEVAISNVEDAATLKSLENY
jgi:[acyl-carrier-protein] S-malonyltransferase